MVALDRPGYGSSAPYPESVARPEQRVQLAYAAVDRILGERSRGAGVFLMGHSGGCELTMRMAADPTNAVAICWASNWPEPEGITTRRPATC